MTAPRDETPPPDREQAIRDRLAAATPGPWNFDVDESGDGYAFDVACYDNYGHVPIGRLWDDGPHPQRDADLIAHAPDDLAYLLELVSGLRASLARAEADLQQMTHSTERQS